MATAKEYHRVISEVIPPVRLFLEKVFTRLSLEGPQCAPEDFDDKSMTIVCSHRSHMDYILLGLELNKIGVKNLRFAAGDNLTSLPYVGKKFTSYGAFSVSRAQAMKRQYVLELCEKVVTMLADGDNIILFPEGGRSYKGNMMEMRNGILAANIFAQYRYPEQCFAFMPMTVSYEVLPELRYFPMLQRGKTLLKDKKGIFNHTFGQINYFGADILAFGVLMQAPRFHKNYGSVYIDYERPIPIAEFVDLKKNYIQGAKHDFAAHKQSIQIISSNIRDRLIKLFRLLPVHVLASVLQADPQCSKATMKLKAVDSIATLEKQQRNCKSLLSMQSDDIVETGLHQLELNGAIAYKNNALVITNQSFIDYFAAAISEQS